MEELKRFEQSASVKPAACSEGKIYFDKRLERKVFFLLTLAMLLWGAVTKVCQVFG